MSRYGKGKKILDPRFPFALEPGSSIFDLSSGLKLLIAYNPTTLKPRNLMTNLDMQDVLSSDISISTIPAIFGNPVGWRSSKTGSPNIVPGNFPNGQWVTHAAEEMTLSFWFRNNSVAPITSPPISLGNHVFVATSNATLNFNVSPPNSKFTVYSKDVPGAGGEEFAIGWNSSVLAPPSGAPRHYLSTRNALTFKSRPYSAGIEGLLSDDLLPEQPVNVLKYGIWHHIAIVIKMGKTFLPSKMQGGSTEYGSSAVYVNGDLVNTFIGYTQPGDSFKPWGSSLIEKYNPSLKVSYNDLTQQATDRLWFPYNPGTNNRSYYQFSAWNRALNSDEIHALYNGTVRGVHVESVTSVSSPPRKLRVKPSRIVKTVNLGFDDSQGPKSNLPFNDNRGIPDNMLVALGSNAILPSPGINMSFFAKDDANRRTDIQGKVPTTISREELAVLPDEFSMSPYNERLNKKDIVCADGKEGQAVIRIPIGTVSSSQNYQIAGRTDSKLAMTVSPNISGSCFLSSAFRNDAGLYLDVTSGKDPTGIAGTGFLYYSPRFKCWIEKRVQNWSAIGAAFNDAVIERSGAYNAIEVNAVTNHTPNIHDVTQFVTGPFPTDALFASSRTKSNSQYAIASASFSAGGSAHSGTLSGLPVTPLYYHSASFSSLHFVTGVNEVMAQFTASPQAGYFLPFKEHLEHLGYSTIGTPTTAFGAPFASRYHANDTETIKMSDYIDRPFRLKKVIVRVPVKIVRQNDVENTGLSSAFDFEWAKNVPARKDLDNYVFFLYRQVRTNRGDMIDSPTDTSSSIRFLIASSSVCVYNSPSFGRAYDDGFADIFGQNTPISSSVVPIDSNLNAIYSSCLTGKDPLTGEPLTYWDKPLHGPSVEVDANLSDFSVGSHRFEKKMLLQLEMTPAVVLGGMSNATMMYVTSSTAMYSTSFWYGETGKPSTVGTSDRNQLFNRYPYTGTFSNPNDKNAAPPITTVFQNFWLGGTRQPIVNNNAKNFSALTSSTEASLNVRPYFAFIKNDPITSTARSTFFNGLAADGTPYFDPNFDIEIGRTGMSIGTFKDNVFSQPVGIVTDGRSIIAAFSDKAVRRPSAIFQRTNLIRFESSTSENIDTSVPGSAGYLTESMTSIGTLSGSNTADLVTSFTTGYFVASPNTNKQVQRDYILLPSDELILGLDAGTTPPPDITPTYDDPHPDALGGIDPILAITVP